MQKKKRINEKKTELGKHQGKSQKRAVNFAETTVKSGPVVGLKRALLLYKASTQYL